MLLGRKLGKERKKKHLRPLTDDMLMIDPRPCFLISGMANLLIRTILVTLMRKSLSQASRLMVVASPIAPPTPTIDMSVSSPKQKRIFIIKKLTNVDQDMHGSIQLDRLFHSIFA
jgi:hypothetical protein